MHRTRLVVIGALAIDTILVVPYFPLEDGKLRAKSLSRRRGGNCPNSLEVLNQLLAIVDAIDDSQSANPGSDRPHKKDVRGHSQLSEMILIASLPDESSDTHRFINASFELPSSTSMVDLRYSIFHSGHQEPVSSYIVSSQATRTRTIINHNELPEMTFEDFKSRADTILKTSSNHSQIWFHFEGRIPSVTMQCMQYLRQGFIFTSKPVGPELKISVEIEKPGREGLQSLAHQADIVFYSKSWAEHEGHTSAASCLTEQGKILQPSSVSPDHPDPANKRILTCTWGDQGSSAVEASSSTISPVVHSPAYTIPSAPIVDTVGAGDTFIAGMLFSFIYGNDAWSLKQKLDFANELAGRKVLQDGFRGLGEQVKGLLSQFA